MRALLVASWSWTCHGNAEDAALGTCAVVGRGRRRRGRRDGASSAAARPQRGGSAEAWLCVKAKPQSLSSCPADPFPALWRLL